MIEGVIKKQLVKHPDERGFFEELVRVNDDFFKEGFGQLSYSLMYPGVIKAWHVHKNQIDWWFVVHGTLKVVLHDLRENSPTKGKTIDLLMGEIGENIVLKIPAQVAHGCKVIGVKNAELFYVTSGVYNPQEEDRIPHNDPKIGYDWFREAPIV